LRGIFCKEGYTGSDYAALAAIYQHLGRDHRSDSVAIIPVGGKGNLAKPYVIFENLGIPVFLIFDDDNNKGERENARLNRFLQRVVVGDAVDCVRDFPEGVFDKFAAFRYNIEKHIKGNIDAQDPNKWDEIVSNVCDALSMDGWKDLDKNPEGYRWLIEAANGHGINFPDLKRIVTQVDQM